MRILLSTITFIALAPFLPAEAKNKPQQIYSARASQAKAVVKADIVGLYVKGFICKSCGIGMKKKIANLKFLDTSKLSKGIKVDVPNQLLFLAITKGMQPDFAAINQAVENAGYDPITYYFLKSGKFTTKAAKSPKSK
jgi:hypothetical protein